MPIELVMSSYHLILCLPLLLPWIFPSIRVFSNELALHIRWPKSLTYSINPSKEYAGWVSLRLTDLISLLSEGLSRVFSSTTVWKHQFFGAQSSSWSLTSIYITTEKVITLTLQTFLAKRCLCFLIDCLGLSYLFFQEQVSSNFLAAVTICSDFGAPKIKSDTVSIFFSIYLLWTSGTRCQDLSILNVEF